jgi:hypothetical protein
MSTFILPGFTYMIFGKDGEDVGGMMTWAGFRRTLKT